METEKNHQNKDLHTQMPTSKFKSISHSTTFRMLIIGFLTLVLLIPMSFIDSLIYERKRRKENVINQINKDWGNRVEIYGPILQIPYKTYKKVVHYKNNKRVTTLEYDGDELLFVFPETLTVNGNIDAIPKKRGIYETTVFRAATNLEGVFQKPNFKDLEIDEKNIVWSKAQILFKTTNNKGAQNRIKIKVGDINYPFSLSGNSQRIYSNFSTPYLKTSPFTKQNQFNFSMNYDVKGSESFQIIPIGKTTQMNLKSAWTNPKFFGEFLPDNDDKILPDNKGFNAHWKIIDYQRPFAQTYRNKTPVYTSYSFGVQFLVSVDDYLKTDRATKYAYLVIFLTFLVFFIIQNVGKINMHPFQYFLIGLALVIFYTLLISISEHINFNTSYILSSVATILLISLYSKAILQSKKFTGFIFASLALLYTYIYVIIQLENYALLVGSIGLFLILSAIMYFSRKIKW